MKDEIKEGKEEEAKEEGKNGDKETKAEFEASIKGLKKKKGEVDPAAPVLNPLLRA